jgi:hypothetical protein
MHPPDAWVALPSEDDIRRALQGKTNPYDFGFVAGMSRLRAAHVRIGPKMGELFREVMFGDGFLTRAEREMIAAVTAAAQDCHY